MQLPVGSLLVSHPKFAQHDVRGTVVYITESSARSTMGITLNRRPHPLTMRDLMKGQNTDWPWDQDVWQGGDLNPQALVMLHTNEWYSSNTMQAGAGIAMSSDYTMVDKLEMGNNPDWFRLFLGCHGWEPLDLARECRSQKPKWLVLDKPSWNTITSDPGKLWHVALTECSQKTFDNYI